MKLTLTASEFADIVCFFLLDKLQNPDDVIPPEYNELFNALAEAMNRRGMRSTLLWYYMKSPGERRMRYKFIRNVFRPDNPSKSVHWLEIRKDPKQPEGKVGVVSRILKHLKNILLLTKESKP
jgi:hypothetical protein